MSGQLRVQVRALYSEGQEYGAATLMLMIGLNEDVYGINEPNEWRRGGVAGERSHAPEVASLQLCRSSCEALCGHPAASVLTNESGRPPPPSCGADPVTTSVTSCLCLSVFTGGVQQPAALSVCLWSADISPSLPLRLSVRHAFCLCS